VTLRPRLPPLEEDAHSDSHREQHGDGDEGCDQVHNRSAYPLSAEWISDERL
jgi:hypothetical protein